MNMTGLFRVSEVPDSWFPTVTTGDTENACFLLSYEEEKHETFPDIDDVLWYTDTVNRSGR